MRALVQQLVAFAPHVVLSPGDLVASMYTGGRAFDPPEIGRFGNFYNLAAPLLRTAPFMVAMGNHEEDVDYFWSAFSFPTPDAPRLDHYWFKIGNVHVTALYTGATLGYSVAGILDSERDWLDRVLTDADNDPAVRWKIVFLHRGAFSQGAHHPTDGYELYEGREGRRGFGEVWERHKVDLVLSGHNHNFTWAENAGVHYVTSCGGAPAHELLPDLRETTLVAEETCVAGELSLDARTISYRAVRPDGSVIDDATFSLCHADADCSELPTPCPEDAAWRCVDHTCAAMCLARPDAGVVVEDTGIEPSVDAGLEKDAGAVLDAGLADAGCIDAGSIHAGCIDAGSIDAGSIDAGSIDAGSGDAGHVDSGSVAVGSIDAGAVIVDSLDAGPVVVDGPFDGGAHPLPTPGADDAGGLPDGCGCASADTSSLGLGCAMLGLFTGQRRRRRARR